MGQTAIGQNPGEIGRALPYAALAAFTLLGFFVFPGHTWLQQDSQIYVAIFEHMRDPGVLGQDPVATHPHVTYTVFDETALALCSLLRLDFHAGLVLQQIVLRWTGLLGVYLLALAFGLNRWGAVFTAALFGLGASIAGPMVLTVEYEPVPRGFAVPLLLLAAGFAAHQRWRAAGFAAAVATLYHPPTTAPFWIAAFITAFVCLRDERARDLLSPLAAAAAVLALAAHFQHGAKESQILFGLIDPELERLQRWRAPYNWLSQWPPYWLLHYPLLAAFCAAALWRLRPRLPRPALWLIASLIAAALSMMAVQYLLLEHLHWTMMASFQPARAVLFCAVFAAVLGAAAAWHETRFSVRWLWLLPGFLLPVAAGITPRSAAVGVICSAAAALLVRWPKYLPVAALAAIVLFPTIGQVSNYPSLLTNDVRELSDWARQNTPPEAVFFFPGAHKDLAPGIFRVEAQRAIYVDWKGGGQVNLLREFGLEWWRRWQAAHPSTFKEADVPALGGLGIDYLVLPPDRVPPAHTVLFRNARYAVIRAVLFFAQRDGGVNPRRAPGGNQDGQ